MPIVKCSVCNKDIYRQECYIRRFNSFYCSDKCRGVWVKENRSGRNAPSWAGGLVDVFCITCGKIFKVKRHRATRSIYCSNFCREKRKNVVCEYCGKTQSVPLSRPYKYCSRDCYAKGKKHPDRYCLDCNKVINRKSTGRCRSCSARHRWANPVFREHYYADLSRYSSRDINHKFTDIEKKIYDALDDLHILHWPQYKPMGCRFVYDEFLPPNVLLEIDGTYWHSLEKMKKRDIRKTAWAIANGYYLKRISETELKNQDAMSIIVDDEIINNNIEELLYV